MKVPLTLKPDEVRALVAMFEYWIDFESARTRHEAIVKALLLLFYKKLKEKSILIERPIRLGVPPYVAMAFCDEFGGYPFARTGYTGNLVCRIIEDFEQKTSGLYSET